jgi:hypothetical protein
VNANLLTDILGVRDRIAAIKQAVVRWIPDQPLLAMIRLKRDAVGMGAIASCQDDGWSAVECVEWLAGIRGRHASRNYAGTRAGGRWRGDEEATHSGQCSKPHVDADRMSRRAPSTVMADCYMLRPNVDSAA